MKRSLTFLLLIAGLTLLIGSVPAAAQEVLGVRSGKVCIGCAGDVPTTELEVRGTSSQILVNNTGAVAARNLFEISNNGVTQFRVRNRAQAAPWDFKVSSGGFVVNRVVAGGAQLQLTEAKSFLVGVGGSQLNLLANGNMTIGGTLTQNSDVNAKENFGAVDPQDVLAKVASLPISTWNYKDTADSERHMGPMAQDFHAAFGLGYTDSGIAVIDTDGVALAAIQGLNQKLEAKSQEVDDLRRQLNELRGLLESVVSAQ